MSPFTYGPVELHLVGFGTGDPDPQAVGALRELVDSSLLRLLDLVVVSRSESGELTTQEPGEGPQDWGLGDLEPAETGLTGDEDIEELAASLEPGTSGLVVAFELVYARTLAQRLAAAGGSVLRTERIPAPVVNELLDAAAKE
ncbi:hypothetical protein AVL62_10015 [Serinicoccus chungangensis]|uniref:DUF1269 domain-containing family protein n=1 Tax=Serinicoccus chungangensis TaxID=767452 RepID=A0A0W8I1X2_9MICO|nr:DUF6325 family protein [Serinicoccus chungangensis]KUG51634.1 hypothetical protein AVL62_10015 [Serinicoccus chungangensis]